MMLAGESIVEIYKGPLIHDSCNKHLATAFCVSATRLGTGDKAFTELMV